MTPAQRDISRKLRIFNYAKQIGNVTAACRHFGISREIYYRWKRAYEKDGEQTGATPLPSVPHRRRGFACLDTNGEMYFEGLHSKPACAPAIGGALRARSNASVASSPSAY